jgi:membrane-associated phospholipid phosphatase
MGLTKYFFEIISFFGNIFFYLIIAILFYFIDINLSLKLFIALIIGLIIAFSIRFFYFKKRPDKSKTNTLFLRFYNSSFPSVHAIRAILLSYFFIFYFNYFFLTFIIIIFGLLIMYSRIYLKKHDYIDIIFGGLIGLLISITIF